MLHISIVETIHPKAIEGISNNPNYSFEVIENLDENNLINKLKDTDAIAIRTANLSSKVIDSCKKLKIISRHGVGYDNIDLPSLDIKKIPLAITINANAMTVAEHVFAMMFYFNKNINQFDKSVREHDWDRLKRDGNKLIIMNSELYNKTMFILGYGRIGRELASRCLAFNMNIIIYDPFLKKEFNEKSITTVSHIDEGLKIADYISIHTPLNNNTRNLINKNNLIKMKRNAFIINASRGGIINEIDLNNALNENIIAGAGLDVFDQEPPSKENLLFNNKKVIFTPHIAAHTLECWERHGKETIQNIFDYFDNKLDINAIVNRNSIDLKY